MEQKTPNPRPEKKEGAKIRKHVALQMKEEGTIINKEKEDEPNHMPQEGQSGQGQFLLMENLVFAIKVYHSRSQ